MLTVLTRGARKDVRSFMTKISAREDPTLPILYRQSHVVLKDGADTGKSARISKVIPRIPLPFKS